MTHTLYTRSNQDGNKTLNIKFNVTSNRYDNKWTLKTCCNNTDGKIRELPQLK